MKKKWQSVIFVVIFVVGLSLLLYPTVSDYWNSYHQSKVIAQYDEDVAKLSAVDYEQMLVKAQEYNKKLSKQSQPFKMTAKEKEKYNSLLSLNSSGVMGYIDIPAIDCSLPIYHGTDEETLQVAIGHIEWTSLPVGGKSTHCVVSGHRGLPRAKIFTNLDKLEKGDIFEIRVLNETLCYEVDQILIVLPDKTEDLLIEKGKDYCTLVTCTPYGVNSHRILVRGHRIKSDDRYLSSRIVANATQVEPLLVACFIAVPVLIIVFILVLSNDKKKAEVYKRRKDE